MDLARTDEQKSYQRELRRFCDREIAPHAIAVDRGERSIWDAYRNLGKSGLLAPSYPDTYGGAGGDLTMTAIFMAEVSRVCGSTALSSGASILLGGGTILEYGTEEQKRNFLPKLARGEAIAALGLTEPGAGSDVMSIATRAVRDPSGDWILRGRKTFITNGPVADVFVVFAVTGEAGGKRQHGTFLVERGAPGLSAGPPMAKLGMRGSPTSEVILDDVRVAKERVLGDPAKGFAQAMHPLSRERAIMPAAAAGILFGCLERCLAYATTRVQFGQPISEFQAIQFKLARLYADIALLCAMQRDVIAGLESGRDMRCQIAAGKIFGGEAAVRGALEAIQLFGGAGYVVESQVERALRDAKLLEIGGGTTEIQLQVIAKALLTEAAKTRR